MKVVKYLGVAVWVIIGLLALGKNKAPADLWASNIWTVCPEGPPICPYSKIQEAIDATGDWDTITIAPGTYVENLEIRKSLRLMGAGRERVHIQAADLSEPTVSISNGYLGLITDPPVQVRLEGFRVVGPNTQPRPPLEERDEGTGILVIDYVLLVAQDLEIAGYSTGLLGFFRGYLDLRNIRISYNGYGAALFYSSQFVLLNSEVVGNTVGLWVKDSTWFTLENNILLENGLGARLSLSDQYNTLEKNLVEGNEIGFLLEAPRTGGYVKMRRNQIFGNKLYGILVSDPMCWLSWLRSLDIKELKESRLWIEGDENEMYDNGSDFCPRDYPRPPGFKKS